MSITSSLCVGEQKTFQQSRENSRILKRNTAWKITLEYLGKGIHFYYA